MNNDFNYWLNDISSVKPLCVTTLAIFVTYLYFHIQDFYHVFVGFYLSMVLGIITWTAKIAWSGDHGNTFYHIYGIIKHSYNAANIKIYS